MVSGFMPLGMSIFGPLSDVIRVQTLVIACAVLIIVLGFSVRLSGRFYKEGIPKPEVNEDDVLQESADAKT
jgi:DHA3 family macrolide efflux protein-like MFS transporter